MEKLRFVLKPNVIQRLKRTTGTKTDIGLAEELGVHQRTIQNLRAGKSPSSGVLAVMAATCNCTVDELVEIVLE